MYRLCTNQALPPQRGKFPSWRLIALWTLQKHQLLNLFFEFYS
jgi:hypothetical protein